ncbi:MAG: hypothetical protein QOC81_1489 [Thermoanaerobaculia bacterium]|nr:hypothetical protein [Thermoanaerobaculia bacterium]
MSETPSSYTPPPPPPGGSYTPPPPPPPGAAAPGGDRTIMIVLSYLWILALIPLLTKKDDPEVQWHAKNGLALLGAEIICWIGFTILSIILSKVMSTLSCGIGLVQCAVWIGFLVVRVMCIVKGVGGQRFRVPVVTDMAEKM